MLLNELPDDCLLTIFDYLKNFDDLANCYKVCIKWSHLIAERTRKVKYLIEFSEIPDYSSDLVYYQELDLSTSYETLLYTLFPNLIILQNSNLYNAAFVRRLFAFLNKDAPRKIIKELEKFGQSFRHLKSLKGIINCGDVNIEILCDKLEMLSSSRIEPGILQNGSSIKQLHTWSDYENFKRVTHYFSNLERLHIRIDDDHDYEGPVLEKLKILEMNLSSLNGICYAFQIMDSCPNLQSVHLLVHTNRFFVDETLKHQCLQDLVIDYDGPSRIDWNDLVRAFIKWPNLKHLSLRFFNYIKDPHIKQLVPTLPNLVLFDIYECPAVTQRAADYVQDYCKRYGRSIKFYFKGNRDELVSDWPQLSIKEEKISRGFNFMKHCFRKDYFALPHFLIPADY